MKTTKITIIAERPKDIPENWLIFNAPRPLLGDKEWEGKFQHGIFYVAVDPNCYFYNREIENNCKLDGWIVEYISKEKAIKRIKEYYHKEYPDSFDAIESLNNLLLVDAFYERFHKEEIEL